MNDLEQIYICSVRYGLGRQNYITSVVSDYLIRQELSQRCKDIIIRDIEECEDYGHYCDKRSWMKLLTYLKK